MLELPRMSQNYISYQQNVPYLLCCQRIHPAAHRPSLSHIHWDYYLHVGFWQFLWRVCFCRTMV